MREQLAGDILQMPGHNHDFISGPEDDVAVFIWIVQCILMLICKCVIYQALEQC